MVALRGPVVFNKLFALLLVASSAFAVTSQIVVTGHASIDQTNYPLQLMRAFVPGEIANCPQGVVSGTPLPTQANVTNRWSPAGSVMLSEVALILPVLNHGTSVTVTWQNQASCNTTALTKSEMQDSSYDFDAGMALTGSVVASGTLATSSTNVLTAGSAVNLSGITDGQDRLFILSGSGTGLVQKAPNFLITSHDDTLDKITVSGNITTSGAGTGIVWAVGSTAGAPTINAATAATMLAADDYTVVYGGSIAQTIKLRNDAQGSTCNGHACSTYDIGFDSNKVIRSSIYATFWPGSHRVSIRYNLEITNSQALENQIYAAVFTAGAASPATVYTKSLFVHPAQTRWTIRNVNGDTSDSGIWTGGTAPVVVSIDHGFEYLISTGLIANYNRTVGTNIGMTAKYSAWQAATHVPFDVVGGYTGLWLAEGASTGDSPQLGPTPRWVGDWLYTQDKRAFEIMITQADLAAGLPYHWREGATKNATKSAPNGCLYNCSASGKGLPVTIVGRPAFYSLEGQQFSGADGMTTVGTTFSAAFSNDISHMTEPFSVAYMVTGDPFILEEMEFGSSWAISNTNPNGLFYGRPSAGNIAILTGRQTRADGRVLLFTGRNWKLSPDGTVWKSYLETALNEMIAGMEGKREVTGSAFQGNTAWNFGYNTARVSTACGGISVASPLRFWDLSLDEGDTSIDSSYSNCISSQWMESYNMIALGQCRELGLPTDALSAWYAQRWIQQLTHSDMAIRWAASSYREPMTKQSGGWIQTWTEYKTGFSAAMQALTDWASNDYARQIMAAAAYVAGYTSGYPAGEDGPAAWAWISNETIYRPGFAFPIETFETDVRYAITPRDAAAAPASSVNFRGTVAIRGRTR